MKSLSIKSAMDVSEKIATSFFRVEYLYLATILIFCWPCISEQFIFLYFQLDSLFFPSTYSIRYPLFSTFFRPHRPIIRRSKLYIQPMVFSPSADVFVVRPLRKNWVLSQRPQEKDVCRGGEYHRLHVQFRPPDDGPVRPETCRGKRVADIVRRRKNSVSSWK